MPKALSLFAVNFCCSSRSTCPLHIPSKPFTSTTQDHCMSATRTDRTPHPHLSYAADAFELPQYDSSAPAPSHSKIHSGLEASPTPAFQTMHPEQPFLLLQVSKNSASDNFTVTGECIASGQPPAPLHCSHHAEPALALHIPPNNPFRSGFLCAVERQIVPPAPGKHHLQYWQQFQFFSLAHIQLTVVPAPRFP